MHVTHAQLQVRFVSPLFALDVEEEVGAQAALDQFEHVALAEGDGFQLMKYTAPWPSVS